MTRVSIQGIRGSYSEEAAIKLVRDAEIVECGDFTSTFEAVMHRKAAYAVVPVENKIAGEIEATIAILREGGFRELGRLSLKVQHVLVGTPDADLNAVDAVKSHIEALKQCRNYLDSRAWKREPGADTASSIRSVVEAGDRRVAAVGSGRAAGMYGAKVLAENIADDADNWTIFCLVSAK